jgi:hypothetical protein
MVRTVALQSTNRTHTHSNLGRWPYLCGSNLSVHPIIVELLDNNHEKVESRPIHMLKHVLVPGVTNEPIKMHSSA